MEKTKIAIGCGNRFYGKDWIHNDIVQSKHIDCIGYAHSLPIESNSMELVYASHVLEYYDWEAAEAIVLPEWKRILKPGGMLRISVPDFNALVKWYMKQRKKEVDDIDGALKEIIGPLFGRMRGEEGLIYHKTTYDYPTLKNMLNRIGFNNIKTWSWLQKDVEHGNVDDHSQAYFPKIPLNYPNKKELDIIVEGIVVEAIKDIDFVKEKLDSIWHLS